jgi:serine phosphatase RsbU (regulator of sigma subunit)
LNSSLGLNFVIYKPKDIVAGDFYWMEIINGKVMFAVADCTGHGVPGAIVSVFCHSCLNRAVSEFGLTTPSDILSKTRELLMLEFEKSEEDVMDGMDIALCVLNGDELEFSGANNPLWIYRENELIELKGDRQPVGNYFDSKPFTTHKFSLLKGDRLYLTTDGYADQFGGEKGKKFITKNLKEFLISIQDKSMPNQHEIIESTFENWKADFEQLDEVCVLGYEH